MEWRWGRREGRGSGNRMWRAPSNGESSLCAPPLRGEEETEEEEEGKEGEEEEKRIPLGL